MKTNNKNYIKRKGGKQMGTLKKIEVDGVEYTIDDSGSGSGVEIIAITDLNEIPEE